MNKPKIESRDIDKLIPYINNSRKHSDEQVAQIAASIKEFGWTNPILVDGENGLIAGHGRLLAARKLGMNTVPVIELAHLTENQKKALIIADNKLALNADWDNEILKLELMDLQNTDFDLLKLGFNEMELANLFDELKNVQIDDLDYQAAFSIVVDCKDEQEQEKIFNELDQKGYKCRVQSL
jgi:ParB-like chromosome segregation protein Spo0J